MYKALLLFILALLPIIILGYYTYSKDSNKEPKKLLLKLFFGGFGAVFLTIILSLVLQSIFPALSGDVEEYGNLKLLLYSFCIISFVEEISKFIFIYLISSINGGNNEDIIKEKNEYSNFCLWDCSNNNYYVFWNRK